MPITEIIQNYLDVITRQQTFAATSLKRYRHSLKCYAKWVCASEYDPLEPAAFVAYYEYLLNERNLEPSSIKNYFAALHGWGEWLPTAGHAPANPIPAIKMAKSNPPVRLLITDEEVKNVIDACDRIMDNQHRLMMTALLTVLSHTALRHQELLDLKLGDIPLKEKMLYVRKGKGNKKRHFPLDDECILALQAWKDARPACAHDYLWTRTKTQRVGYDALNPLIAEVVCIAGYKADLDRFKCHTFRHNAATFYYRKVKDLPKTMRLLGHNDLKTTQRYLHTGDEEMMESRNAMRRAAEPAAAVTPANSDAPAESGSRPTSPTNLDLAARTGQHKRRRMHSIRTQR